jgi:Flp pilus assembly protein TadD
MKGRRATSGVLLLFALAATSCARFRPAEDGGVTRIRQRAAEAGLVLPDPLEATEAMHRVALDEVGLHGTEIERIERLARFLNDSSRLDFRYGARLTLTARQAFLARQGDCFAYANLFAAMARGLRVPVHFVRIQSVHHFEEHGDSFFVLSHIAVSYSSGPATAVAEMPGLVSDWRLSFYRDISDEEAAVLFYNNRAVDLMEEQDLAGAARLLRFLTESAPSIADPWNNLGVSLLRKKKYDEALELLDHAMARFPDFAPLFANGALAAAGAGQPALAKTLADKGRSLSKDDPYLIFGQGLGEMAQQNSSAAAALFLEAVRLKPDNALFLGWLASASLSAGKPNEARNAFLRARELAPNLPLIRALEANHPELSAVR